MTTDFEYEQREARMFHRELQEVEKAPLRERQEARNEYLEAMKKYPDLVAERIGWIINGSYGKGSYDAARRVLASRMNKVAWFSTTIAALEWRCPQAFAVGAWKKLTPAEKQRLDAAIKREIKRASEE